MEILSGVQGWSTTLFAVASMLSVGLRYTLRDLVAPLRNTRRVIAALTANFVLVPLLGFVILQFLPLAPPMANGLALVAAAGGAPLSIKLTQAAGSDVGLSATLLLILLPVTIVFMPLFVPWVAPVAEVSAGAIARPLVLYMLLPLAVGLAGKAVLPRSARRLQPVMGQSANILLAVLIVSTFIVNFKGILSILGTGAILASILFIGGAFLIGRQLGGNRRDSRTVLAFGTAHRNYAAAIVVAEQSFADPLVLVMVVVVSTVSLFLLPFARVIGKRGSAGARSSI